MPHNKIESILQGIKDHQQRKRKKLVSDDPQYIPSFVPVVPNPTPPNLIDVRIENQEVIKPLEPIQEEP